MVDLLDFAGDLAAAAVQLANLEEDATGRGFDELFIGIAENGLGADGEILFAFRAMIPLAVGAQVNLVMFAVRAILPIAPARFREMLNARRFIAEIIRKIGQRFKLKYRFHYVRKLH